MRWKKNQNTWKWDPVLESNLAARCNREWKWRTAVRKFALSEKKSQLVKITNQKNSDWMICKKCDRSSSMWFFQWDKEIGPTQMNMNITHLQPIVSLIAGIAILIVPRLLNYIVAIFLIVSGIIGLGFIRWPAYANQNAGLFNRIMRCPCNASGWKRMLDLP